MGLDDHIAESTGQMSDYRKSLRTVGIVLIVVGVLDIGWMVRCIVAGVGYSSCFNIFALVAGILLCRGSLKTARVVAFFSAFLLAGIIGVLFVLFPMPPDLIWTYLRLQPLSAVAGLLLVSCLLALLAWVYRRLSAPLILEAMAQKQVKYKRFMSRPSRGFIIGAVLVILLLALGLGSWGRTAGRAKIEAKKQVGEGYKFYVRSTYVRHYRGGAVARAGVTAYNQHEIRHVEASWEK